MNLLGTIIGILSFNETESRITAFVQRAYFILGYNTTFPVNAIIALGGVLPYMLYLIAVGDLSPTRYLGMLLITLFSAYAYTLIYIVNDIVDRHKDRLLSIPKQSARHVVGSNYIGYAALTYLTVVLIIELSYRPLFWPAVGYSLLLIGLSLVHSYSKRTKVLTIFIERFLKFISPLGLIAFTYGGTMLTTALVAAAFIYPMGFTLDYAFSGYLRERIKKSPLWRYPIYGLYWLMLAIVVLSSPIVLRWSGFALYIVIYFALTAAANTIAKSLSLHGLQHRYEAHVALEKSRLIGYAGLMAIIVILGGIYVVAS